MVDPGAGQIAIVPPDEVWVLSQPDQVVTIVDQTTNEPAGSVPIMTGQANGELTGFGMVYGAGKIWVAPLAPSNTIEEMSRFVSPRRPHPDDPIQHWAARVGVPSALGSGLMQGGPNHWHLVAIDPNSGQVVLNAKTGLEGYGVEVGEGSAWVANRADSSLSKVDPRSGTATTIDLAGIGSPTGLSGSGSEASGSRTT